MQTQKPLFRPEALRPVVESVSLTPAASARGKLGKWAAFLSSPAADKKKETELLPDFLRDVFVELLGYTGPADSGDVYTLKREVLVQVGRKKGLTVADVKRLRDEFAESVRLLQELARDAAALERIVSDTVNAAFGLTPAEVALMWQTAPPRMPIAPPA